MSESTPIFGAMSRLSGLPSPLRRSRWLGFLIAMEAFHTYPLSDLVHRHLSWPPLVVILVVQTGFALVWLRTMWLALGATVPFRVIRPWLVADVLLGVGMAMVLGGQYKGLLIYLSIACAVTLPLRWTLPALAACAGVDVIAEFRNPQYLGLGPGNRLNEIVGGLSLTFFLGLMMWFYRRVMMLVTELRQAHAELARLAVTEERLRFARDLHDLLGHSLTTIALKSQLARRLAEPDSPVAREVTDIESVTQQALAEVREAVTGYRARSLVEELDTARSTLAAAGIDVTVRLDGTPLPARLDALLGWVVREGTTNVLRHSMASSCEFRLSRNDTTVSLAVHDDGVGGSEDCTGSAGNGLAGLAERLSGAGGRLDSGPAPVQGFRLAALLPLIDTSPDSVVR
jgi:two-component system, NarL family, sensor histidine kinase DesK